MGNAMYPDDVDPESGCRLPLPKREDLDEAGKKASQTWADYVNYDMEHGDFNVTELREFMRGLVEAGQTKSGHRTP